MGRALGRGLRAKGWKIGAVAAKSLASAKRAARYIGTGRPCAGVTRDVFGSRVVLIATPDDAIASVAREMAKAGSTELRHKIVLHTSGALDSSALQPLRELGAATGSMHPLQTFSGVGVPPLEGRIFSIEGDPSALRAARQIARSFGAVPVVLSEANKALYHAAAVMAAGHILAVEESAVQMLMSVGMSRREAQRGLLPLTRQVLDNFERLGPRAAWTGPLARRDFEVVAAHVRALKELPVEFGEAYIALSRLAARMLLPRDTEALPVLERIGREESCYTKATGRQT